ncbi:MAG TPA: DUF3152 domain-containing protein [Acidimicrobiia bacterium]|nr:DUF3152 domain-containing protein [Acidimicrobiia bacterium]
MAWRIGALAVAVVTLVTGGTAVSAGAADGATVITYSVRGRGNVSPLEDLAAEAARVYTDPRGWSLGGSLRFERVATGGAFTLWLAADAQMSTFGGACDRMWSCRNGRNVVINEDRWLGSSDSYREVGAPLETYRQMVLNHETGHWLGFGHATCRGRGQPAPVMQQQSMTLAGCRPNPWPLASEQAALATRRRLPLIQRGAVVDPGAPSSDGLPPGGVRPPRPPASRSDVCLRQSAGNPVGPWIRCF